MIINSVLTPLIRKELPDLLHWIKLCPLPCEHTSSNIEINWFLSIDSRWSDDDKDMVSVEVSNSNLANYVKPIYLSLNIDPSVSVYLKGEAAEKNHKYLRLGNASGPNNQFFKSVTTIINDYVKSTSDACILLEVDAMPIKKYWLDQLNAEIQRFKRFLVVGASPSDKSTVNSLIQRHLNGNAIYGLGDTLFPYYLKEWKNLLESICIFKPTVCYDVACEYFEEFASNNLINKAAYSSIVQSKGLKFDINPLILNINNSSHEQNFLEIIDPSTIIVHSKLYQQYLFNNLE